MLTKDIFPGDHDVARHADPDVADRDWLINGMSDPGIVAEMVAMGSTSPPNCVSWVNWC